MALEVQIQLIQSGTWILIITAAAATLALAPAFSTAFGQGYAVGKAVESIGRQPEASGSITSTLLVGCALAETGGIYGLMVALLLIFLNPFFNAFLSFISTMGLY